MEWKEVFSFGEKNKTEKEPPLFDWTEESLNEHLRKHEKEIPPVAVKFFLSAHGTEYDARKLKELIRGCDIFVPEGHHWQPHTLELFRNASRGGSFFVFDHFADEMLTALAGTGKAIAFVDVPSSEKKEEEKKEKEIKERLGYAEEDFSTFEKALESTDKESEVYAEIVDAEREQRMLSHLGPEILKLFREHPEWKDKERLRILLQLGGAHTGLYHELKAGGNDAEREFSDMPYIYSFDDELVRTHRFKKNPSEELIARAFLENFFVETPAYLFLKKETLDSEKLYRFIRVLFGKFSAGEIREMFEDAKSKQGDFGVQFGRNLDKKFEEKGIVIPQYEDELDEFLKQHETWRPPKK